MNHPLHIHESKNNPNLPQVSTEILVTQVQKTRNLVDGAIEKMKAQEEILLEKKRRIEEIAVMCEESGDEEIVPFGEIIRKSGDVNKRDKEEGIGLET